MPSGKKILNVAHIINSLEYGGAEKVLVNIVNNEDLSAFKPFVFSLSRINPLSQELNPGTPFFFFDKKPVFDFVLVFKLLHAFRLNNIDILHVHGWGVYPESFLAAYLAGVKIRIVMDHGRVSAEDFSEDNKSLYERFKGIILAFIIKRTTAFIAVSSDIEKKLKEEKKVQQDKIFMIHNGVPFMNISEQSSGLIHELKGASDPFIICSVGRLAEIKNYLCLIEAFSIVCKSNKNMKLIIFGDGDQKEDLEKKVLELNLGADVFFPGFIDDVRAQIAGCDLFVLPSFYEGISISLLEAMSVGLPIIASDVGGNLELIEHGVSGLLFDPHKHATLAQGIVEILNNSELRLNFSMKCKKNFEDNFTIQTSIKKYHEVYLSTIP